jgi:predicted dehydrogenase
MVAAAQASGKMLMVAHVLPYFPEFAFAREAVASGRYGALKAAHFHRVIARPDWSAALTDADRSGGPAIDLHIHDTHFVGLLRGVPLAVRTAGVVEGNAVVHLSTQYLYGPGGPAVSSVSGALSQAGRPFAHGFEIYLEKATLAFEFANLGGEGHLATPLSVILPDGTVEKPALPGSGDPVDAFVAELGDAVAAVSSGVPSPGLSGDLARQALRLCHAEVESARTGHEVAIA